MFDHVFEFPSQPECRFHVNKTSSIGLGTSLVHHALGMPGPRPEDARDLFHQNLQSGTK